MVPPTWNERERVEEYVALMEQGTVPTAVALSTLDVCQSALGLADDPCVHWGLTHFLLDGHHKLEAGPSGRRLTTCAGLVGLAGTGGAMPARRPVTPLPAVS